MVVELTQHSSKQWLLLEIANEHNVVHWHGLFRDGVYLFTRENKISILSQIIPASVTTTNSYRMVLCIKFTIGINVRNEKTGTHVCFVLGTNVFTRHSRDISPSVRRALFSSCVKTSRDFSFLFCSAWRAPSQ